MKTISINLYQFDELNDKAKEVAREWYKKDWPDHGWWDSIYDDAKEVAKYFGVEINKICFSGFWSQGDGGAFTGTFRSADLKTLNELKESYPTEEKLHALLQRLHELKHPEGAVITIKTQGFYSHSGTMWLGEEDEGYDKEELAAVLYYMRSFADWIYASLEKEHEYLTSNECVDENIRINEYWFLVDGSRNPFGDD